MRKNLLLILMSLTLIACMIFSSAAILNAQGPYIWQADTVFGSIDEKSKINQYLDDLRIRGVNGIWVQVEFYVQGAVNYKKTNLTGLPTLERFTVGEWENDDFLSYVIEEAKKRDMQVMIKFHGSHHPSWDENPDWRKVNSKGEEVLWGEHLKNFCVNAPYWDEIFFPMLEEIAENYDVDGFYFDTCQVAYESDDSCFCKFCQERFESETGKHLPLKPVDRANWDDEDVKLHAIKRVEWVNEFHKKYGEKIEEVKPGAISLLNVSGGYNSYKDTLSSRHAGEFVTYMTPEPVNTPRMWAVHRNRQLKNSGQEPLDEMKLAMEEIVPKMNRFGYHEFMVKTMLADGGNKPVIPISRFWFTKEAVGYTGPTDLEIFQIESAIGAGAKGFCFFGYLGTAIANDKVEGTAWADPKFIEYMQDLTSGPRSEWIADMQPDARLGILYDRDQDFWTGDYWKRMRSVGALYALIQYDRKVPATLISTSSFGDSGHKLCAESLKDYYVIVAPGLDYVSKEDLRALREYLDDGGRLILMGGIGRYGEFLEQPITDEAFEILGVTTIGDPEPSGFIVQGEQHPIFTVPGIFTGTMNTSRISDNKFDALSFKSKYDPSLKVLAWEVNDSGRRAFIISREKRENVLAYVNSDMVAGFNFIMQRVINNILVILPGRGAPVLTEKFSETASVNAFRSSDGMTRYFHILTLDGEEDANLRIRADEGTFPVSVEIINGGGEPTPISIVQANRGPEAGEMTVVARGNGIIGLPKIEPGFAMVKVVYEKRETDK